MAANFPKLPGFVPTHDPTLVDHKKISHIKLEKIRNAKNVDVPLHALPRQVEKIFLPEKPDLSKSLSHMQYPNHQSANINELFEPTFVKLDKQVSILYPVQSSLLFLAVLNYLRNYQLIALGCPIFQNLSVRSND